jgi:hypothetical protein
VLTQPEATVTGVPEGFNYKVVTSGTITDFGTAKNIVASFQIFNKDGKDVTDQFANIIKTEGTLTINKRQVILTSETASKPYDGIALEKPVVTVGGNGFVEGEVTDIKATGTITTIGYVINPIVYTEQEAFKADNYTITKNEGTLTITADSDEVIVVITENSGSKVYNGSEQSVTGYEVTSISNSLYKVTDFTFNGEAVAKGTNAGTYDMGVTADMFTNNNTNFANVTFKIIDGTLEITPLDVTVTITLDKGEMDELLQTCTNGVYLQAYIFAMLTMLYISNGFPQDEYEKRKQRKLQKKRQAEQSSHG